MKINRLMKIRIEMSRKLSVTLLVFAGWFAAHSIATAQQPAVDGAQTSLKEHVLFFSSFDESTTADLASGDGQLFTAENSQSIGDAKPGLHDPDVAVAEGEGLVGNALQFKKKDRKLVFYKAAKNFGYESESTSGAVSFWMRLNPANDLEPGYCDPIQITDSKYNDAAIWVDFTKENPRDFRLGIIGDLTAWNPDDKSPDGNPEFEKRLITVKEPPFQSDKWTHIVINFSGLSSDEGQCEFFVDGESKGALDIKDPFTWDEEKANILLGLNYIGYMDELAVFDRTLSAEEVARIHQVDAGLASILK